MRKPAKKIPRVRRDAAEESRGGRYVLRLFISGTTQKSMRALTNLKAICEERLKDRYDLEVIDIYQQPELARNEQIVAVPVLIKKLPPPLRRVVGDLSAMDSLLVGLDLQLKA